MSKEKVLQELVDLEILIRSLVEDAKKLRSELGIREVPVAAKRPAKRKKEQDVVEEIPPQVDSIASKWTPERRKAQARRMRRLHRQGKFEHLKKKSA